MKKIILGISLLIGFIASYTSYAQGTDCASMTGFCTSTGTTFAAGVNVLDADIVDPGNDYGCLLTSPNPAWYYIEVDNPGGIDILLTNSNGYDIDFALWGPFANLQQAQLSCGTYGPPIDCSYSINATEQVTVPISTTGQVYVLLITNYSNFGTNISATQNGGTGSTNCAVLCGNVGFDMIPPGPYTCNDADVDLVAWDYLQAGAYIMPSFNFVVNTDLFSDIDNSLTVYQGFVGGPVIGTFPAGSIPANSTWTLSGTYFTPGTTYVIEWCDSYPDGQFPYQLIDNATGVVLLSGIFDNDNGTYCYSISFTVSGTAVFTGPGVTSFTNGTGLFSPSTVGPGTYSITYSWDNGAGCSGTSTQNVVVTNPNNANWTPPGPLCQTGGAVNLDLYVTGTPGGTWSGTGVVGSTFDPAGLSGSIAVTYTVGPANCQATQTQNIIVNVPVGSANFTYSANTYCQTSGVQSITLGAGATAGTFTYTGAGTLSLNAATGDFDPATSTPGTYTITNTIPGSAPCPNVTFSQSVTIVAPPVATFTYVNTVFCQSSGLQPITLGAGATAGTFTYTAAAGGTLSINPATGTIDPSFSTPDTYTITNTVIGTAPCGNATATQTVTIIAAPTVTITPPSPPAICVGDTVQLDAVPAVAGVSYQWYLNGVAIGGATGTTYFALVSGSYTVEASALGCTSMSAPVIVTVSPMPTATITPAGPTTFCSGDSVTLDATVGAGYTYQWYLNGVAIGGATGASYVATLAGNYTVDVMVGTCSATSAPVTVTVNPAPNAVITPQGPLTFCIGGSVILDASTGATYTYQWYLNGVAIGGATGSSYTANASGSYTVEVTDNGCVAMSSPAIVVVTPIPTATITPMGPTTFCSGDSVTLNATIGAGYTYQWYLNGVAIGGATGASYVATVGGSYSVDVNSGTCGGTSNQLVITVTPGPTAIITPQGPLSFCIGGSVILDASTGATYAYQWYFNGSPIAGATSSSYTATASGSYYVEITDNGCVSNSTPVVVTVNPAPTATITPGGPTTICAGNSVILSGNFGVGYTYQWYLDGVAIAGATSQSYTATTGGVYTLEVSLGSCVTLSSSVTVTVNPLPTATATAAGPTTFCAGGNVQIDANAGAGYTYQWNLNGASIAGATSISYTANASGNYSVTVTLNGCSATSVPVTVTVNPMPIATISPVGSTTFCTGGSVILNASSAANYTYQWYLNGTMIAGATNASYTANAAGNYTVVIDALGCTTTSSVVTVTINPYPNPVFVYDDTVYCVNAANPVISFPTGGVAGTFTAAPGGLNVNGITGNITLPGSLVGSYTVTNTVTSNGCTASHSENVTLQAITVADFTYGGLNFCQTGSNPSPAYVNGGQPGTFSSSPVGLVLNASTGVIDLTTSAPGAYTVTNTPTPSLCSGSPFSLNITISPGLNAEFTYPAAVYCLNSATNPTVSHNNGGTDGTYSAVVVSGGSIALDPITGTINLATSTAGTYDIFNTVAGNAGCSTVVAMQTVTLESAPDATFAYDAPEYCQSGPNPVLSHPIGATDGMYSVNPNVGLSYDFSNGSIDLAASVPGTYTITNDIPATVACAGSTHSETITIYKAPDAEFDYDAVQYCKEGSAPVLTHITGTDGAYTYIVLSGGPLLAITPTNGSISLLDSDFGTYQITNIVPANGVCPPDTQVRTITIDPAADAEFYYDKTLFCSSSDMALAMHLTGTNGVYSYTGGSGLALDPTTGTINLGASGVGTYFVSNVVPSVGVCPADTHTVAITYAEQPIASLFPVGTVDLCAAGTVNFQANGGGNYTWYYNNTDLGVSTSSYSTNTPGMYQVVVSNAAGCADTSEVVTVIGGSQPAAVILPSATQICLGQSLTLQAQGIGNMQWLLNGNVLPTATTDSLLVMVSGTYSFVVSNSCGSDTASVVVNVSPGPMADFIVAPNPSYVGVLTSFTDQSISGAVWSWNFGSNNGSSILQNPAFTYEIAGTYDVTMYVEDVFGCKDTAMHPLTVLSTIPDTLFVPNIFTPDGDGVFDEWVIVAANVEDFQINVFDRWGVPVFEALTPDKTWKGLRANGTECESGVYYYALSYKDNQGEKVVLKGNVTLMR